MSLPSDRVLWFNSNRTRYFLFSDTVKLASGEFELSNPFGESLTVDEQLVLAFEVEEEAALSFMKADLSQTLDELKQGLDTRLTAARRLLDRRNRTAISASSPVTASAADALLDLLHDLPGVIGRSLSGDAMRLEEAKSTMASLQEGLKSSGMPVDERFANFPSRLAELRSEFEKVRGGSEPGSDGTASGSP